MNTTFTEIIRSQTAKYVGVGLAAFSGGTVLGYFLSRKKSNGTSPIVEEDSSIFVDENQLSLFDQQEPIAENKEDFAFFGLVPNQIESEDEPMTKVHIFKVEDEDWDYQAELSSRDPKLPYIIHRDEFIQEEMGYDQSTVTYYRGDDIMADIHDVPIYNHSNMFGELKFGHGSGDKNVVYIRNETLQMEWEVLLHTGRYEVEVLGNDIENYYAKENLAHAHSVLKFRDV